MRIRTLLLLACLVLLVPLASPAVAGPSVGPTAEEDEQDVAAAGDGPPHVSYAYEVQTRGEVHTDPAEFAATAASILGDARGWTLGGSVAFEQVGSGGDFNLVLASPQAVEDAHPVCSRHYSCRVGDDVLINDRNWRNATSHWNDHGAPLWLYRQYLINHEVGHFLGFDHHDCPAGGGPAPVMEQQSIDTQGCDPNGWPLDWEREALGDRLGVPVYDDWIFPDVLRGDTHRDHIHTAFDAGITQGYEDGYYRQAEDVPREQMATFLARSLDLDLEDRDEPPFDDVDPDGVHADAITAVTEEGVAEGRDEDTFRPHGEVTRAQMATFLARAYDLEAEEDPRFDDVDPDGVHAEAIAAVDEHGIAQGYGDDTYRPNAPVTRAEMATFLVRAHPDL